MARASILQPALRAAPYRFRRPMEAGDFQRNRVALVQLRIHAVANTGATLNEKVVAARRWLDGYPPPARTGGRTATLRLVRS